MTQITIFTAPKPFVDPHIVTIQRNAIQSWIALGDTQVILVGNEEGIAEAAQEFGVVHLPDVETNDWGTPLVSSIFDLARNASTSNILAYVNADIILMSDFMEVIQTVDQAESQYLAIGQRWDLDVRNQINFNGNWEQSLLNELTVSGKLHAPSGSDYFVFPKETFKDMPDFAIGRAGWDNWMIYHGLEMGFPVIDATLSLTIIHQNHDYSHLPGGRPHYDLEETKINAALGGGMQNMFITLDANKVLVDGNIRNAVSIKYILRRLERHVQPEESKEKGLRWELTRKLRRIRRKIQ